MSVKKLVFVGDGYCGKTSIIRRLSEGGFCGNLKPTIIDTFVVQGTYKNRCVPLMIWDTSGQEDWPHIRKLAYPETDVVILVFAVSCRTSFTNIFLNWYQEIKEFCPRTPIILVGNKTDLRTSCHSSVLTLEGQNACKTIGAVAYIECSALKGEGIHDLLMKCSKVALKSNCSIL